MSVGSLRRVYTLIVVGVLVVLSGCGQSSTEVQGVAGASFLENSTVEFLEPEFGTIVETGKTDELGKFEVTVPVGGPYLVKVSQGTERIVNEDGSVKRTPMKDGAALYGMMMDTGEDAKITVSPATTLAYWIAVGKASAHSKYVTKKDMEDAFSLTEKLVGTDIKTAPLLYSKDLDSNQRKNFLKYKLYNAVLEKASGENVVVSEKSFNSYLATLGLQYGIIGKINRNVKPTSFIANNAFVKTTLEQNGISSTDKDSPLNDSAFQRYVTSFEDSIETYTNNSAVREKQIRRVMDIAENEVKTYAGAVEKHFSENDWQELKKVAKEVFERALKSIPLRLEGRAVPNVLRAGSTSSSTLQYVLRMSDGSAQVPADAKLSVKIPVMKGVTLAKAASGRYTLTYDGSMLSKTVTPVPVAATYTDDTIFYEHNLVVSLTRDDLPAPKLTLRIDNPLDGALLKSGTAALEVLLNLESGNVVDWPVTFSVDQGEISLAGEGVFAPSQTVERSAGSSTIRFDYRIRDNTSKITQITLTAKVAGQNAADTKAVGVDNGSSS